MSKGWWLEGGWRRVEVAVEGRLKYPMVGVGLRSGCVVVELAMRLPRGGRLSVRGRWARSGLSGTTGTAGTSRTQRGG